MPADLLSASAHKFNGPKGVGFLVVRGERALAPWLRGGSQERGRRGGTHNVPGIAGLGVAAELARVELDERAERCAALRDRLWSGIEAKVPRVRRNGAAARVLPNTLCVEFAAPRATCCSRRSTARASRCRRAPPARRARCTRRARCSRWAARRAEARASLRFSVGHGVDEAQIDRVLALLPDLVARVRARSACGARHERARRRRDVGRRRLVGRRGAAGRAGLRGDRRDAAAGRRRLALLLARRRRGRPPRRRAPRHPLLRRRLQPTRSAAR